ncbi:uncharacterized protein METZ01_LOCUS453402, partial [marine metagenome]
MKAESKNDPDHLRCVTAKEATSYGYEPSFAGNAIERFIGSCP